MCGICGFTDLGKRLSSPAETIEDMKRVLRHRGPDEEGTYKGAGIFLGHDRLSIIGLKNGKQPISNEDRSVWVTFNGEIYNYRELRELLSRRHKFYTDTDTETIVHLYEELGEACVEKLDGMFSFCIWDSRQEKAFCARDRFGKKPFYYALCRGEFVFSSELKGLLQYPGLERQIELSSLSNYLAYEYVPSPRTIFRDINKLPAGHYLTFRKEKLAIVKYWDFAPEEKKDMPLQECIERMEQLLERAVEKRLMSEVPLGVFLSGGIDSSAVAYFMSKAVSSGSGIKSFSIGFKESSFDESFYSGRVAGFLGTEHHHEVMDHALMLKVLPEIISKSDEPFADASVIPTYLLSGFARKQITVALSGDGGDELFYGYDTFPASKLSFLYERLPGIVDRFLIRNLAKRMPVSLDNLSLDFKVKQFLKGMDYGRVFRNQVWLGAFSPLQQEELFNPELGLVFSAEEVYKDISDCHTAGGPAGEMGWLARFYIKFYMQDDILAKVDRASMMNSLEVRCPFLDIDLFQFVNSLPDRLKLKGLATKYILRRMLQKKLPMEVVRRRKKGFNIPVAEWFRGPLRPLLLDVLSETQVKSHGFFRYPYVKRLIEEHLSAKKDNRKELWTLFIFQQWFDKWAH